MGGRVGASVAQEGGGGRDSTRTVVRGGRDPTIYMRWMVGGGSNHVIGWWVGGYVIQILRLFFNTLEIIFIICISLYLLSASNLKMVPKWYVVPNGNTF